VTFGGVFSQSGSSVMGLAQPIAEIRDSSMQDYLELPLVTSRSDSYKFCKAETGIGAAEAEAVG